jgi:hypothetical protein
MYPNKRLTEISLECNHQGNYGGILATHRSTKSMPLLPINLNYYLINPLAY